MSVDMALREFRAGIEFWNTRRGWPRDLHCAEYREWANDNPDGDFSDEWWTSFLHRLGTWRATRPVAYAELTRRFESQRASLTSQWERACRPYSDADITEVAWEQVRGFADAVSKIKPMAGNPSPVFTSKFCHFLLPRVFPVVDNLASGGHWGRYEDYFMQVQDEWAETPEAVRDTLRSELATAVECGSGALHEQFPVVNKIVELRLIGRRHLT